MHFIDIEKLLEIFEDDRELIEDLAQIFLGELPEQLAAIQAAIDEGRADLLKVAAHALKGASSNFRVEQVTSKALELEMLGRGGTTEGAQPVFDELKERLTLFMEDLSELTQSS